MVSINSTGRLLGQIRAQITEFVRTGPDSKIARMSVPENDSRASSDELESAIAKRVLAIAANDPERRRKAFLAFLEAVLIDEFSEALLNDSAFEQMVKRILTTMEARSDLATAIDKAGDYLLVSAQHKANSPR